MASNRLSRDATRIAHESTLSTTAFAHKTHISSAQLVEGFKKFLKLSSEILISYDPSAGSPTETLLRLLLPLSAPVRVSLCRTPSLATSVRQSKHLTGTLNR